MSKELIKIIRQEIEDLTDTHYEPKRTEDIDKAMKVIELSLEKALERAKKVEELLELYREHINNLCKIHREGVKNSLFSTEYVAYELYEKIKALEEELK